MLVQSSLLLVTFIVISHVPARHTLLLLLRSLVGVGSKGYGSKLFCMPNNNPLLSSVLVTDFPPLVADTSKRKGQHIGLVNQESGSRSKVSLSTDLKGVISPG